MATLCEMVVSVDQMEPEGVICAKPEWRPDCEARFVRLLNNSRIPDDAKAFGREYFLEVDVIRQVGEEFHDRVAASLDEKFWRLIDYAVYEA